MKSIFDFSLNKMKVNFIQIMLFLNCLLNVELEESVNDSEPSKNMNEKMEEILELNDSDFDLTIQKGNNNRWLILFYLETCYHCYHARTVLNRILEFKEYKNINKIKFASVEVEKNSQCNDRFNVSQVPYIILVENGTMIEFDSYANEKNLINFIETNYTNTTYDIKIFPKFSIFKYYFHQFERSIYYAADEINKYLESKNINFKFTALSLILSYIILCFIVWTSVILCIFKCFNNKNNHKKNSTKKSSSLIKKNEIEKNLKEKKELENKSINDEKSQKMKEEIKEKEKEDKNLNENCLNNKIKKE